MMNWIFTKTPLMFLVQSIWRDEAFSYLVAKEPLWSIPALTAKDFNPPLYYIALHIYMWVFGHSEIMLRAFSLIFFNITIFTAYLIIENVFGKKHQGRWVYVVLFAFNPFLLYYGFEARMYAMTACLTTLSWYFLWTSRPRKYLLTVILGLLTHYFFLFVVLSQLIYYVATQAHRREQKIAFVKHLVPAGIVFGLWGLFVLSQNPPISNVFWILPPTFNEVLNTPGMLLTGYENIFRFPNFALLPYTLLFLATMFLGYKTAMQNRRHRDVFFGLMCWIGIPVIATLILSPLKPLFLPRYLMICTPGILLLIIHLIGNIPNRTVRIALVAFYFIAFTSYHTLQINFRKKADFRSIVREIKIMAGKNDLIYVENELNLHPVQYYFNPQKVFIIGKTYDEIPDYVGKVLIPPDRIIANPPRYPDKAFIIHDDLSYSIQSVF